MWTKKVVGMSCVAAFCAVASAQTADLSGIDKAFMKSAAEANMTEAHFGKMAEDKATNDAVKSFGQILVQDHTKAYDELTALANKTGESIPRGIDTRRNRTMEDLSRESGSEFDRRFVADEVQDHRRTIAEFKREAEKGQNADVKAYAQSTIPTLKEHLHKAEELEKSEHQMASASAHRQSH